MGTAQAPPITSPTDYEIQYHDEFSIVEKFDQLRLCFSKQKFALTSLPHLLRDWSL